MAITAARHIPSISCPASRSETSRGTLSLGITRGSCLCWFGVPEAVDQFRSDAINAFEADQVMFQYSRAAKELWKFCNGSDIYVTAGLVRDYGAVDWWDQGAPRGR